MKISTDSLFAEFDAGHVTIKSDTQFGYRILNYTKFLQFNKKWNDFNLMCRGLIVDDNNNIIARPFAKFFNIEEIDENTLPKCGFKIFDKMDGSLGILYFGTDNKPYIATRGSFDSEQAVKATDMLYNKYQDSIPKLDRTKTYLFEIIYPENRIVLDYGRTEELVLLAIIDTESGVDCPLQDIGFPIVKSYDGIKDLSKLRTQFDSENCEGFVVLFDNGFRVKLKYEEYIRLHKIITHTSSKTIWESLKSGKTFDDIIDNVPDEFFDWTNEMINDLYNLYDLIETECLQDFNRICKNLSLGKVEITRSDAASAFKKTKYPHILFRMFDDKKYDHMIWDLIKPKFEKPFR